MHTFEYQILRYMPDRVSGEFLNLGLVVFNPQNLNFCYQFASKTGRISEVFPGSNSRYILKVIQAIQFHLGKIADLNTNKLALDPIQSLDGLTRMVLPKDDSALYFTETAKTLDLDIKAASDYLFQRLVSVGESPEAEKEVLQDKQVWSKLYKKYFEDAGIMPHLKRHEVQTKFDEFKFEHAWKNGHWNFFEPVAFNLEMKESVKNKVYRLSGKIDSLSRTEQEMHLYLLSNLSSDHKTNDFVNEMLLTKSNDKFKVEIVTLENVEEVTNSLAIEIANHEN